MTPGRERPDKFADVGRVDIVVQDDDLWNGNACLGMKHDFTDMFTELIGGLPARTLAPIPWNRDHKPVHRRFERDPGGGYRNCQSRNSDRH